LAAAVPAEESIAVDSTEAEAALDRVIEALKSADTNGESWGLPKRVGP
jgi:hypothetical protein